VTDRPDESLSPALARRVLRALDLPERPATDHAGLCAVYAAWCRRVPFDNVRKTTALFRGDPGPLPGIDPEDFFEAWLADGTGGTCWPSCNALFALLVHCGFDVRRAAASMLDAGEPNHGTIVARADDAEWLVDSSMLTGVPLPLREGLHGRAPLEAEVEGPVGSWRVWFRTGSSDGLFPCRLLATPATVATFRERYEASRAAGPFNGRLYARRNTARGTVALRGAVRHELTSDGAATRALDAAALREALVADLGVSRDAVRRWEEAGVLQATLAAPLESGTTFPELPPSRRGR